MRVCGDATLQRWSYVVGATDKQLYGKDITPFDLMKTIAMKATHTPAIVSSVVSNAIPNTLCAHSQILHTGILDAHTHI